MNIVFVHLGDKVPKFLKQNILTSLNQFPQHRLILIRNSKKNLLEIPGLQTVYINNNSEYERINSSLDHPKHFRGGFWAHSLNRFIALADFAITSEKPLIHFESDVIVASDFPFEAFSGLSTNFAFPLVSDERGIASTFYIGNPNAGQTLKKTILNEISHNKNTTDMKVLKRLYDLDIKQVTIIPTTGQLDSRLKNRMPEALFQKYTQGLMRFGGVIDGADFGFFLLGSDPRNKRGFSEIRTLLLNHYVVPTENYFEFNPERSFVNQVVGESQIPIYSLHATCKNPGLFKDKLTKILKKRIQNQNKEASLEFVPWAFRNNIIQALIRRTRLLKEKLYPEC